MRKKSFCPVKSYFQRKNYVDDIRHKKTNVRAPSEEKNTTE